MVSDANLTRALQSAVEDLYEQNAEDVRPKSVRARAEEKLGLNSNYFANNGEWKERSKDVIQAKYEQLVKISEDAKNARKRSSSEAVEDDDSDDEPPTKKRVMKPKSLEKSGSKAKAKPAAKLAAKTKTGTRNKPLKHSKKTSSPNSESANDDNIGSDADENAKAKPAANTKAKTKDKLSKRTKNAPNPISETASDDDIGSDTDEKAKAKPAVKSKANTKDKHTKRAEKAASPIAESASEDNGSSDGNKKAKPLSSATKEVSLPPISKASLEPPNKPVQGQPADEGLDDSDLSSLIDEPPPRARKKKAASSEPASKAKSKSKPKKSAEAEVSPQQAELRELQSHLVQCGIRKIWAMHLKKFETHKEKANELKRMLRDVGMEGRFSKEKARQIKETRELQADIEAVQEGEDKWGKQEEPKRKSAGRAQARIVDFDDEESD